MTARLVTIGDSLTQGFQHGAIRRTDWSFPALVARALGPQPFRVPDFAAGSDSLLLDLELLLDRLSQSCGERLDLWEAPLALLTVQRMMSGIESYWERGPGTRATGTGPVHHNLGVWGFEVLDALTLSDAVCARHTPAPRDNLLDQLPEEAMYRTARRTFNPSQQRELSELTAPSLARHLAIAEGVENLLVALGANNALGTCATLRLRHSREADLELLAHDRNCNLWRPEHFAAIYADLARQIEAVGAKRVFLATVPHVTIAPITRGVSPHARATGRPEREGGYYEFYTRFWIWDRDFDPDRNSYLTREQAREIDATIDAYNAAIRQEAGRRGWPVVDLCGALDRLAFRRNDGQPSYPLPPGLIQALRNDPSTRFRVRPDGQVLYDTRFFRIPAQHPPEQASTDVWRKAFCGGFFGLDGVHPTTTGYGIVAHEILSAFRAAGVPGADPGQLDWTAIVANDHLLREPPALMVTLEKTLDWLFAKLPLDALIDKLAGYAAEEL